MEIEDKYFDSFLNYGGFGPKIRKREVPDSSLLKYRGKLPQKLIEYWSIHGWCGYAKGLFWTVDPTEYQPAVDAWLSGTPFAGTDNYHMIAMSAFGKMFIWGEETGPSITIHTPYAQIYPTDCSDALARRGHDLQMQLFFSTKKGATLDLTDDDGQPLFQRAYERLGVLAADEMYGFVPALALGGRNRIKNLQKVKAVEHLVMLADLGERKIMADIVKIAKNNGLM